MSIVQTIISFETSKMITTAEMEIEDLEVIVNPGKVFVNYKGRCQMDCNGTSKHIQESLVLFLSSLVIGYRIRECEDRIGKK